MGASRHLEPIETPLTVEDVIDAYETDLYRVSVPNESEESIYPTDIECTEEMDLVLTMSDGTRFKVTVEEV